MMSRIITRYSTSNALDKVRPLTSAAEIVTKEAIDKVNAVQANAEIKQTPDGRGWGLFAKHDIQAGEQVFRGKALHKSSIRCAHSVQTDWDEHVLMDLPAVLVNHSCNANLGIKKNDFGAYDFFALEHIAEKEELLWDYETVEAEISGWKCTCGAHNCRGHMKGFKSHADQVLKVYGEEFVAPYLLEGLMEDDDEAAVASH